MQGALRGIAKASRGVGYVFDIKIRILIPNANAPADVLATDWAHRVDRRVADAQEEGFVTYRTQRQYILPEDTVRTLPERAFEAGIGQRSVGQGSVGGDSGDTATERLGSNARPRFVLEDADEGRQYPIAGVQYLPDRRNVAIIADSEVA